jgi:general secretion pathway protein L
MAGQFFAWWRRELSALLPAPLAQWWRGADRSVLVTLGTDGPSFDRLVGAERQAIALPAASAAPTPNPGLGAQLARAVGGRFRQLLCLQDDQVLVRRIELPLAVEENLTQTLRFELDRYTPFKADQVYFNHRVVSRDSARQKLVVDLVLAARPVVDDQVARCRTYGLAIDGVVPAATVLRDGGGWLDLLPSSARGSGQPVLGLAWRILLGGLSLLLLAAVVVVPIWQKRQAAIDLMAPLATAKQEALEADQLRERLVKLTTDYNFLPAKKWEAHSTVRLLDDLSHRLPDDTFVIQLDFDGKTVQVQGESGSASTLVELLEASPLMRDVVFKAQLTKLMGSGSDRFHVAATLEHAQAPAASEPPADANAGQDGSSGAAASPVVPAVTPTPPVAPAPSPAVSPKNAPPAIPPAATAAPPARPAVPPPPQPAASVPTPAPASAEGAPKRRKSQWPTAAEASEMRR